MVVVLPMAPTTLHHPQAIKDTHRHPLRHTKILAVITTAEHLLHSMHLLPKYHQLAPALPSLWFLPENGPSKLKNQDHLLILTHYLRTGYQLEVAH
jgi:hypothetical protein